MFCLTGVNPFQSRIYNPERCPICLGEHQLALETNCGHLYCGMFFELSIISDVSIKVCDLLYSSWILSAACSMPNTHIVLCVYWAYCRQWTVFYWTKSAQHTEAWRMNQVSPSHWRSSVRMGEGFDLHLLLFSLIKIMFSNTCQTLSCIHAISPVHFRYRWHHDKLHT
jgi:hypothetical protein